MPFSGSFSRSVITSPDGHQNRRAVPVNNVDDRHLLSPVATYNSLQPPSSKLRNRKMVASPRSSNYERLEGGMGPSRMSNGKWFAWKKFAIGAAVIIAIVWFFGPRESASFSWSTQGKTAPTATKTPHAGENDISYPKTTPRPNADSSPAPPPVDHHDDRPAPVSFVTDPDPSKTVFCSTPYKPSLLLVQYAVMIDAGSTGSRVHVYKFNNCGPSPMYEYETFKMIQPGLSAFSGRPVEAAESLDPLLEQAVQVVPESLRKCTLVAVKATAGLRLLGATQSADILDAVKKRLQDVYPFQLLDTDAVVIMDGKDEGVYAWITANYLLNTIRGDTPANTPTYAVLDLGGASTQIVFKPTFSKPDSSMVEGEHKYDLQFGGKTHVLYQHSYLGYGLMQARRHVHQLVEFMASLRQNPGITDSAVVGNPCLAQGTTRVVEVEDERADTKRNVTMTGEDIGSFEACNRIVQLVMAKDAICELKPCSFNGVYQPSLLDTFPGGKVLLLSYYFDRLNPLLPKESQTPITVATIASLAHDVCQGRSKWLERWGADQEVMEELTGRPEWCLDLTFMHGLLRLGYEFRDEREVKIGKQIGGTELGWTLGASIAMVGGDLKCRI